MLNDGDAPELSANQAEDIHDAAAAEMKTAKCLSIEDIANLALDDAQPEEEEAECLESDSNGTDDEAAEKELSTDRVKPLFRGIGNVAMAPKLPAPKAKASSAKGQGSASIKSSPMKETAGAASVGAKAGAGGGQAAPAAAAAGGRWRKLRAEVDADDAADDEDQAMLGSNRIVALDGLECLKRGLLEALVPLQTKMQKFMTLDGIDHEHYLGSGEQFKTLLRDYTQEAKSVERDAKKVGRRMSHSKNMVAYKEEADSVALLLQWSGAVVRICKVVQEPQSTLDQVTEAIDTASTVQVNLSVIFCLHKWWQRF